MKRERREGGERGEERGEGGERGGERLGNERE